MGWDGAGGYSRQHNFSADASAGVKILALRMDQELDDIASAIPIALAKNGQNVPTANLPMGGFRHINVGAPTSVNNYMRSREFIENVPVFMDDTASSADRISVSAQYFTSVSANQAPGDGTRILVRVLSDKSSAVLYLNGHSANVEFQDGNRAAESMVSGGIYEMLFSSVDAAWKITRPDDGRTAAERAAGVTPTNYQYEPGDFHRYNAVGDGSADDGPAVRAAVLQSLQSGGAVPFGQPGKTYLCTTWTTVDTTAAVRLRGNGCTLKGPAVDTDFCRPGGSVDVERVIFDRWLSVFEREIADSGSIDGFRVRHCEFNDIASVVINVERPITNYWICENHFHDCAGAGFVRIGRNTQSEQTGWTNGHILHNVFEDIAIPAGSDAGAMLIYGYDAEIVGNVIDGVSGGNTETWGIYTKCIGCRVHSNIVRNVSCSGANAWGINIKGEVRTQTGSPQGFAASVIGNYVHTVTAAASSGYCIRLQTDSVVCQGNMCEEAGNTGIALDYAEAAITGISSVAITGNLVRFTTAGSTVGIRISTGVSYVGVSHNKVVNASIGIRAASITGSETDWTLTHNTLEVTVQGIIARRDEEIDGLLIAYNIIKGSPSTGVRFEAGTGVLSKVSVLDNDLLAATTQFSGTLPADIEIRHKWTFQTTAAGPTTAITLSLADEASYFINYKAIAVLDDGAEANGYHRDATVMVNGGAASLVGSLQDASTPQETTAAWDAAVDATAQTARMQLTGEAASTINWNLWIHVLGVSAV